MNVWIYDENSYPSGFAGGLVPEAMPESRGRGLAFDEAKQPAPSWATTCVARLPPDGRRLRERHRAGPSGRDAARGHATWSPRSLRAGNSPWYGGRCYVDLLYPGVTEKFLEVTLERLPARDRRRSSASACPASFTDEPQLRPAGGLPWTDRPARRRSRSAGATACSTTCPACVRPVGDWKQVRHNYYQVLLELFIERWAKPYYDYCEKHGLEFTGHYWEHEWPNCLARARQHGHVRLAPAARRSTA